MNTTVRSVLCSIVTFPLLPVLFFQGLGVRRHTPRLAEAGGPSFGSIPGSGEPIKLITLGEFTVAGVGATSHKEALTGQIASALQRLTGRTIDWLAMGKNGATAETARVDLLPCLAAEKADTIVVVLGVNDVLRLHSPNRWHRDLEQLVAAIQNQLGKAPIVLAGMPPIGKFPALPQPLKAVFGFRAKMLEQVTWQLAEQWSGVTYCPISAADNSAFSSDGFHPGPLGYSIWGGDLAERVAELIRSPVTG